MAAAQKMGMPALAMTDHGVLYGTVEFYTSALAHGIKPIIGCEIYVAWGSRRDRSPDQPPAAHLVLLAANEQGYYNLVRLVTAAHLEGYYYKPRIDKELLARLSSGLIGLSACLKGEVAAALLRDDLKAAIRAAGTYADILGTGNFYLELEDHGLAEQQKVNRMLPEVARRTGLPLVATNDVHYLRREHHEAHDIMLCLQTQTVRSDPKRMRYRSQEFYFKTADEMWELFADFPESLRHTREIAERCNLELELDGPLHFPVFRVPEGSSQRGYLEDLARKGLRRRYGIEDADHPRDERERAICERFFHELNVIERTGFINYFLVVWDFVDFARNHGIPVGPGRGSGCGSLVAYALGITGVDPLKYNLIFERFLNPERISPPDFDIDFCQLRRDEVIDYVRNKYRSESVAQIITFGSLGARTLVRDVGRVLEIPFAECDRLARMIPEDPNITLQRALEESPDFRNAVRRNPHAKTILQLARILEGLPRHAGTHAAGVVIAEKPLVEIVPLARDKEQNIVTQFEMKSLEKVGLLKMDFLGLKTLTVIQKTLDNIERTRGKKVDIENIPMDDRPTFDLLNRGDTVGVFQVESRGMRDLLRRIGLNSFPDLIAMIALFRPGPMNMLDDYVNRKHGKVPITYDHPLLEPILKETYGVMLYQEQVQQAANVLAGFTLGQGDILRRAMGKKNPEVMGAQRERFIKGCWEKNRIPADQAARIFERMERFAGYGFNKSHSTAYAILSYQTAYLKAHYPVEFMAALMTSEMGNTDKLPVLIEEARNMEIAVLPPDINESLLEFTPVVPYQSRHGRQYVGAIRFGLAGVKNVGAAAVEAILAERTAKGPFKGLIDFCERMDSQLVNRKIIESLIKCGSFDFTHISRGRLFRGLDTALARAGTARRDRRSGQGHLFGDSPEAGLLYDSSLPEGAPWSTADMLAAERDLLGFYVSGHPLKEYEWILENFGFTRIANTSTVAPESIVRLGGMVTRLQRRTTRKTQENMATFRLEGIEGAVEVVVFPSVHKNCGVYLKEKAPVMVTGELHTQEGLRLKAAEIHPLHEAPQRLATAVYVRIPEAWVEQHRLAELKKVIGRCRGPTPLYFCIEFLHGEKVFTDTDRSHSVRVSEEFVRCLEHLLGEGSVYVEVKPVAAGTSSNAKRGRKVGNSASGSRTRRSRRAANVQG